MPHTLHRLAGAVGAVAFICAATFLYFKFTGAGRAPGSAAGIQMSGTRYAKVAPGAERGTRDRWGHLAESLSDWGAYLGSEHGI